MTLNELEYYRIMSKNDVYQINTNSIILCERCNTIDDVRDGSLSKIILPQTAKLIKGLVFYGKPTINIAEPYSLKYELYSEGFYTDITTYFYEIHILNPSNGFDFNIKTNILLYNNSPISQLIHGVHPAVKINPYKNGIELRVYVRASKQGIRGLEISVGVIYE